MSAKRLLAIGLAVLVGTWPATSSGSAARRSQPRSISTLVLAPTADAWVDRAEPRHAFGRTKRLEVSGHPAERSFLNGGDSFSNLLLLTGCHSRVTVRAEE